MLAKMSIRNLAVIESLELDFHPGLNVFTGETGAGKSVLMGALSLILGQRASSEAIRSGAEEATVQAWFDLARTPVLAERARELGWPENRLLSVQRQLRCRGRSRAFVGERSISVAMLADLLNGAVELTGQHEHVGLIAPESHLGLLDAFARANPARAVVEHAYRERTVARDRRDEARARQAIRDRRLQEVEAVLNELDAVDLEPGEHARLRKERDRLRGARELGAALSSAERAFYSGDNAVIDVLARVQKQLHGMASLDDNVQALAEGVESLIAETEELARQTERCQRSLEAEPGRLEVLEQRLSELERVFRRCGGHEEGALKTRASLQEELEALSRTHEDLASAEKAFERSEDHLKRSADHLSQLRFDAAPRLDAAIRSTLSDLGMRGTCVEMALSPTQEPGPKGSERGELVFRVPGEAARSLRKTASGGELARVLLGLKTVLAKHARVTTHVFDEVDTGVGGAVAEMLGLKLSEVARSAQVIAVTHLAPVAAFGNRHFFVSKAAGPLVRTAVETLEDEAVTRELARMLAGAPDSASARAVALELRHRAQSASRSRSEKSRLRSSPRPPVEELRTA